MTEQSALAEYEPLWLDSALLHADSKQRSLYFHQKRGLCGNVSPVPCIKDVHRTLRVHGPQGVKSFQFPDHEPIRVSVVVRNYGERSGFLQPLRDKSILLDMFSEIPANNTEIDFQLVDVYTGSKRFACCTDCELCVVVNAQNEQFIFWLLNSARTFLGLKSKPE